VAIDLASENAGDHRVRPFPNRAASSPTISRFPGRRTFDVLMALIDQCGAKVGQRSAKARSSTQAAAMPPATWATI
jgi:hypothetical protein